MAISLSWHKGCSIQGTKTRANVGGAMTAFAGVNTTELLVAGMRLAQDNHRIIANNIANVDTPRYNPVEMDFQSTLRNAVEGRGRISLRRTRPQHLDASRFSIRHTSRVHISKNDYNKVDIEQEIANLAENRGRYNVYGSILVKQFAMVKSMLSNLR